MHNVRTKAILWLTFSIAVFVSISSVLVCTRPNAPETPTLRGEPPELSIAPVNVALTFAFRLQPKPNALVLVTGIDEDGIAAVPLKPFLTDQAETIPNALTLLGPQTLARIARDPEVERISIEFGALGPVASGSAHIAFGTNFSDHGANRLGASALMQGLADGYFVLPNTISSYLAPLLGTQPVSTAEPAFAEAINDVEDRVHQLTSIGGTKSPDHFHRELGRIMWNECGMSRTQNGLEKAISEIQAVKEDFYKDVRILGGTDYNLSLEKALRVVDFFELGELMCRDALDREESCGGHFREEYQTDDGEALRRDDLFMYVAAWSHEGEGNDPRLHKEHLNYEYVKPTTRSYK